MAVATQASRGARDVKTYLFNWEGLDKNNKTVRGDLRAASETVVTTTLRRQGIRVIKVKRLSLRGGGTIKDRDITFFTRQLSTMMRAGVPLLQSFDIVARGHSNPRFSRMLLDIKGQVESGTSLSQAFRRHPMQFDGLYCNLVAAGEQAGVLDTVLDRLATYKEKILAIKGKIKSALFYPAMVITVAVVVVTVIMVFVIPSFKEVFSSFGASLPGPTLIVIAISDFFVAYWYFVAIIFVGSIIGAWFLWKRVPAFRRVFDRVSLKIPIIGKVLRQAAIARWSRTLATMFAAGVPLVDALESVAGAAGNQVYADATRRIRTDVSTGTSLSGAMIATDVFPNMVLQMTQIGEESGSLDGMLNKVADFYEREVDDAVTALSSLMEPILMVFLGIVVGGLVIAMYLPIFKLGSVVG
ncbi:MAG: type II secretion system F family protein [Betaproteobacteria bacterium]|nr:type II secretion system F family protein [Betaproteobacteria bacterium]